MGANKFLLMVLLFLATLTATGQSKDPFAPPSDLIPAEPAAPQAPLTTMTQEQLAAHILPKGIDPEAQDALSIVYNAFRRSQLEPCGCVTNQLGGIDREGRIVHRLGELGLPLLKVDAGGFLKDSPSDTAIEHAKILLRALATIGYQAVNVSYIDLGAGGQFIKDAQGTSSMTFLSANITAADGSPVFEPYKVVPVKLRTGEEIHIGIIGLTRSRTKMGGAKTSGVSPGLDMSNDSTRSWIAHEAAEWESAVYKGKGDATAQAGGDTHNISDRTEALKKYMPELRQKSDLVVLLMYDKRDATKKYLSGLAKDLVPDIVICGDWTEAKNDVDDVQGARIVSAGFEGRHVGHLLLNVSEKKVLKAANQLVEIPQNILPLETLSHFVEEVAKGRKSHSSGEVANRPGVAVSFAGSKACQSCHQTEFEQWEGTKHATAMKTLIGKNQQYNHDCLRCHTTGYKIDNGFTDFRITPQFGDVQCEVCHGPAQLHVVDKRKAQIMAQMGKPHTPDPNLKPLQMEFNQNFCIRCHDSVNDKDFQFDRDIQLVNHTREIKRSEQGDAVTSGSSHM